MASYLTSFVLLAAAFSVSAASPCAPLIGIDDDTPGGLKSANLDLPLDGVYNTLLNANRANNMSPILNRETPIALRIPVYLATSLYDALAPFHETAIEHWGRKDVSDRRRRCMPSDKDADAKKLFDLHRRVSLAYTFYYIFSYMIPGAGDRLTPVMEKWGLPVDICEASPCASTGDKCPVKKPPCDESTPWGLAHTILNAQIDYELRDGWNSDGSMSRSFNKIPFEDPRVRPYIPRNDPWSLGSASNWQPLKEHNGLGFLFNQEHVVPYIGETAKSVIYRDAEVCARTVPYPNYDYPKEVKQLLDRSSKLDDLKKVEISLFDNKLIGLTPLTRQYYDRLGKSADSIEVRADTAAVHIAMYEAVIAVWRDKEIHDTVRPPSIIKALLGKKKVRAYAGPNQGIQWMPADEWLPYIRMMPHAEFPSGSSCVCKAFEESMVHNTGTDDVTGALKGKLNLTMKKGSSTVEKDFPPRDWTLEFAKWSEVTYTCGESRLDGGMHFPAAVRDGETLCAGIGHKASDFMKDLVSGKVPSYVAPFEGPAPSGRRC